MSLERVHPPQVHQHRDVSAAAAALAGQPPKTVGAMFGMITPEFWTS